MQFAHGRLSSHAPRIDLDLLETGRLDKIFQFMAAELNLTPVELAEGAAPDPALAPAIEAAIRERLIFTAKVELVAPGSLARSEYKSRLVDYSGADDS